MIPPLRSPLTVVWEITDSCNLACVHCRATCGELVEITRNREVEKAVCEYVLRERVFVVNISGGEPLLHPDLPELVHDLSSQNVSVGLSTNGLLWPRFGQKLVDAGLAYLQVSVDGPRAVHGEIRRNPRSFDAALRAVKSARDLGLRTQMNTLLSTLLLPHLEDHYELALELGVDLHFRRFVPVGRALVNAWLMPTAAQQLELLRRLVALKRRGGIKISIDDPLVALLQCPEERDGLGCGAGITQLGISMNGDIYPCIFDRKPVGNLLREDLRELWEKSPVLTRLRDRTDSACGGCSLLWACGGCRACIPLGNTADPYCPQLEDRTREDRTREDRPCSAPAAH